MTNHMIVPFGKVCEELKVFDGVLPSCISMDVAQCIAREIANNLWPTFDQRTLTWPKKTPSQEDLTTSDLVLMAQLYGEFYGAQSIANVPPNDVLFASEDLSTADVLDSLERYLYGTSKRNNRNDLAGAATDALGDWSGLLLYLKLQFQRMRPFQAALLFGCQNFTYQRARSAYSPSLPSGHCFQGIYIACRAYEAHLSDKNKYPLDPTQIESLAQFGADVGDRRVFAGVHYPSDNIASWFVFASIIPHCFGAHKTQVQAFFRSCLSKSKVKQKIDGAAVFCSQMKWLENAINTPPCP